MDSDEIKNQFAQLIASYILTASQDFDQELEPETVEKALRAHAQKWGGCIPCIFSRAYQYRDYEKDRDYNKKIPWTRRNCVLGLNSSENCVAQVSLPELKEEE